MDYLHTLDGYGVVPLEILDLPLQILRGVVKLDKSITERTKELAAVVQRHGEGARARARLERRNRIIDGLRAQQMTDPKQILAHLVEHEPELVYKSKPRPRKRGPGKPATFIQPKMMMLAYERWKRAQNDRGHSE
jgi:hypothetical protein